MIWFCIIISIIVVFEFLVIVDLKGRISSIEDLLSEESKTLIHLSKRSHESFLNLNQHISHTYILLDLLGDVLVPGGPRDFFNKVRNNPNISQKEVLDLKEKAMRHCFEDMRKKISEALEEVDDPVKRCKLKEVESWLEDANVLIGTLDKNSSFEYRFQVKNEISKIMSDIAKNLGGENLL